MNTALNQLVEGLDQQIENVHTIISELRPAALDELGLRPAVEALAERHSVIYGTEVFCDLDLPDPAQPTARLAPEVETTVYRLIQEALNNAGKHAHATEMHVRAYPVNGAVKIEVSDDGKGFDTSNPRAGFGLTGMRERVSLAGGTIEISSRPGGGTTVCATIPTGDTAVR